MFENLIIAERLKYREYHEIYSSQYFWRTYDGSEVDLVEERNGKLYGFEIKWNTDKKVRKPKKWLEKNSSFKVINKNEFVRFII